MVDCFLDVLEQAARGDIAPYLIERIENAEGEVLFLRAKTLDPSVVLSPSAAWMTSDVLAQVMDEGTGSGARALGYEAPCHGKTGTTDEFRDAWFAGFTDKVTCGVWVGMDRPRTIVYKGYGSTLALPIWTGVMKAAEETEFAAAPLQPPVPLVDTMLCRECGLLESRRAVDPYGYAVPQGLVPSTACTGHFGRSLADGPGEEVQPIRSIGRLIFGRKKRD
ncbi:MAG: penicillin-binding transpeptidase domain-containing protein [Verrucomicrobiota bacterium]